ncbi:MAG TPA: hypothetical protein VMH34_01340 [Gammaproteobacteria bacterium]|nr:hypothetical protein [Gammaproteobacteria bacterium]
MMKSNLACIVLAMLVGGMSTEAEARGSWHGGSSWHGGNFHGHGGFHNFHHFHHFHDRFFFGAVIGSPFFWGPYPYYDYPPASYMQEAPPVYVQQQGYWYYCPTSKAYFPYVSSCDAPWQPVAPQPPQ